jgi:hypothetical protein
MKNLLFAIMIILNSLLSAQDIPVRTGEFPEKEMKSQNSEIVKLVAKEISQTLPQTIDKYTTFTTIIAKGTTLIYTFEINTGAKSDETIKQQDRSRMKSAVTQGICQSSRKFLEAGINISYIYISEKSKTTLFEFDITLEKCINSIK